MKCSECGSTDYVGYDDYGNELCEDCLFAKNCREDFPEENDDLWTEMEEEE